MAELDQLEIIISASAKQAEKAIGGLADSLGKLSDELSVSAVGLEKFTRGLNELVSYSDGLKATKNQINGLVRAMRSVSDFGKVGDATSEVISKAKTMTKSLKSEFGVKSKEAVAELRKSLTGLYSSVGDDAAIGKHLSDIDKIIRKYGTFAIKADETSAKVREFMKTQKLYLSKADKAELGDDLFRKMGTLGAKNITSSLGEGLDAENYVRQINSLFSDVFGAVDDSMGVIDISNTSGTQGALLALIEYLEKTKDKTLTFREAVKTVPEVLDQLGTSLSNIASSVGTTLDSSIESYVHKMGEMDEAAKNLNPDLQRTDSELEGIAQPADPFSPLAEGLRQFADIHIDDSLANLKFLKEALSKIGGEAGSNAATALPFIAQGIREFDGLKIPQFGDELTNLALGLRALGTPNITNAATSLPFITQELRNLSGIKITADIEKIAQLANALARFGYSKVDKAVTNMPALSKAVTELVNSLSTLPPVSENTIRLMEAMGNLNVHANNASKGTKKLGFSLKNLLGHTNKAQKSTKSLAAAVGKLYASYWLLFRLLGKVGKAITLASDLKEVQNVVDVTFGDMADKMNEFAKNAVDTLGMSELTAKQIGSRFQAMGSAMGISNEMVKNTNAFVQAATHGYADVANSMADVSINLTRLAGDMASFYNQDYAEVAERLQAVFTGQTRPLRAYGLDLTNATLQEWALNNGMKANIKTMTQAEKTLLRYQYVLAQTTAAHGDFERTIGTWANQIKIAKERLKQLGIILGQIAIYTFKPLVTNFNNAMKGIIKSAEGLLNALGKIFGWKVEWSDGGVLQDEEEAADDLADDMGDAADNAKKFKNFLLGIDELNLLPDNSDKDKGDGGLGGLAGGLKELESGLKIVPVERGFESLYDTLYKLGRKIADVLKNLLKSIDWETVYKKAERFGKSLAQFFNGLLADAETFYEIGKYFAGGINSFAHMVDAFHKEFDGWQLGVDIGNLINGFTENLDWDVIKRAAIGAAHDLAQTINGAFLTIKWNLLGKTIAEGLNTAIDYFYTLGSEIKWSIIGTSIADAINGLFANFDFAKAAKTLSTWVKGFLDTLISLLERTDWDKIGESIGDFIANIDFAGIGVRLAKLLWAAANAAVKAYAGMFNAAPVATAIATAIGLALASKSTFKIVGKGLGKLTNYIGMSLSDDLGRLFTGDIFKTFGAGFKGYFANLDAVGMTGNNIGGIAAGFNAVSASLSNVTKVLGTAVVGFGEFVTVKDSIYDIVAGTDDMGESFVKLGTSVGIAGVALTALLGVPTGLIVTGVVAGIGAIAGLISAMDDLREANAITALTKDMGDAYSSMGDLVLKFKDVTEEVSGGLDKLNKDYEKVTSLKNELGGLVKGYDLVVSAVSSGNEITGKAMDELIGNISNVKSAWEDYINAQYDYLIQSTINDYQFAKSQGLLTEGKEQEYINRINELSAARDSELSGLTEVMEELRKAQGYYNALLAEAPIIGEDNSSIKWAEEQLRAATQAVLEFGYATGAAASGGISEIESSLESLKNVKIDFSDFDASNYDEMLSEATGYFTQLQEAYQNSKDVIEQTVQDRMKADPSLTEEEARADVQMYVDALNGAAKDAMDSMQLSIFDIWTSSFSAGDDVDLAGDMKANFIIPLLTSMTGMYEEVANGEKPKLESITNALFRDLWLNGDKGFSTMKIGEDWKTYADEYRKQLEPISEESKKVTRNAGNAFEDLGKQVEGTSSKYEAIHRKVKESADAFEQSGEKTKKVRQSVEELSASTGNVVTGFDNMENSFSNTDSVLLELATNFDELNLAIIETLPVTGEAFTTFFSGIQTDAESLLTWFTETFEPRFTSEYWTTALSGVVTGFSTAFNNAIEAVKGLWNSFAEWAKTNMKIKIPKTKMPDGKETEEIDLSVKVGSFYNGGFPEDGFFFANHSEMVGQFSNGKTAVANNQQIVEGIKQGVYEAVAAAWSSSSGNGNVTVEITGDASDIFRAVVRENDRSIMRTGASPIRV